MKFCKHCGKQLDDDAKFCSGCGTSSEIIDVLVTGQSVQIPIETEKTKEVTGEKAEKEAPVTAKKRKAGIVWAVVAAAVIIGAVLASVTIYNWYNNDEQRIIRALNAGEYEEALEIVKTDEVLKDSETLADKLVKRIGVVEKEYCDEKIAYADAVLELNTIQKMGMADVLDEILETKNHLSLINQSRMCFSSAETFFKDANYVDAMRLYAQVIEEDGNYEKARKQYSETVNKYREQMLDKAAEYAQKSDYTSAIEILDSALSNLPDDSAIMEQRLVYEKAKKEAFKARAIEDAAAYANTDDYESAITELDNYKVFNGEDTDINLLRQEYCNKYAASVLSEAQKEVDNNKHWLALDRINSALSVTGSNELLTNKLNEYKNMYVEYVLKKSAAYIEDKDYDRALIAVNVALEDLPGNEKLLAEQKKINDLIPKNLLDVCSAYETDYNYHEYKNGKGFKMSGDNWTNGFVLYPEGYAYFNLNGNYDVLEFDCGHIDGSGMFGQTITIYLDGIEYKTIEVSAEALPQHFSLEVTGVKQLKFQMRESSRTGLSVAEKYGFANVTVQ